MHRLAFCVLAMIGAPAMARAVGPPQPPPMVVVVDMDPNRPGIQSTIQVRACAASVSGIAIYIHDPSQAYMVWSIGYRGGIDRGIAFGHTVDKSNVGSISDMTGTPGTPVNPGNKPWVEPGYIPLFDGGEIHYLEFGADAPSPVAGQPIDPVCTIIVEISNARPGDRFRFYLLDYVSVWSGATHGAFSVSGAINSLDAGGDSVPDQTITSKDVDPDQPVPSPPAPFLVDYIDGPISGGGAVIEIIPALGDITADGVVNVSDLLAVINAWGPCPAPPSTCAADVNEDGVVNVSDLLLVINNWGECGG